MEGLMARIRTVKPEFFQQEELAQCSPHARLLAIAILQLCDANGVFRLVPMQVHAHAFPWEAEVNIRSLLGELESVGYLETYTVGGKEYGYVDGFRRHQRLSGKEAQAGGYYPLKNKQSQEDKQSANTDVSQGAFQGSSGEAAVKHLGGQEQGNRGIGKTHSNECGSAAAADDQGASEEAADPIKQLFDTGVAILCEAGVSKKNARSKIGHWRKSYQDGPILNALIEARKNSAVEPIAYVEKTLQGGNVTRFGDWRSKPIEQMTPDQLAD
jgi:hypothetical protein